MTALQIKLHHLSPAAWGMRIAIPCMKLVADTLPAKQFTKFIVVIPEWIGFTYCQQHIKPANICEQAFIVHIGYKLAGHVKVNVFIVVTIKQVPKALNRPGKVIPAAHANKLIKQVREF